MLQNFKLFVRAKADHDKDKKISTSMDDLPAPIKSTYNKIVEQLATIDQVRTPFFTFHPFDFFALRYEDFFCVKRFKYFLLSLLLEI